MAYFFWDGDRILEYGISSTEMDTKYGIPNDTYDGDWPDGYHQHMDFASGHFTWLEYHHFENPKSS